jgi:hypothetical protein
MLDCKTGQLAHYFHEATKKLTQVYDPAPPLPLLGPFGTGWWERLNSIDFIHL